MYMNINYLLLESLWIVSHDCTISLQLFCRWGVWLFVILWHILDWSLSTRYLFSSFM